MSLSILSVAYPFAPVGPQAVGGAEAVLFALESELVRQGYRSLVLACEGSAPAGELLAVPAPQGLLTEKVRAETTAHMQQKLDHAFRTRDIDLVHLHGIDFALYHLPEDMPVLVTLHLPPGWYPDSIWNLPPNYQLVCVSESQRQSCPDHARTRLRLVPNGVTLPPVHPRPGKREFALMLARICPEKNLHAGFDAARLAGIPCVLGGEAFAYEEHLRYLHEEIQPRLGPSARWPGPLTGERKRRFLQAARCVLLPTLAPETSSLLAMEALAAGTPVVAFRSGALPEIVEHGRTGFLVNTVEEMAEAITRTAQLSPAACRAAAAERFSFTRMAVQYLDLYTQMASQLAGASA